MDCWWVYVNRSIRSCNIVGMRRCRWEHIIGYIALYVQRTIEWINWTIDEFRKVEQLFRIHTRTHIINRHEVKNRICKENWGGGASQRRKTNRDTGSRDSGLGWHGDWNSKCLNGMSSLSQITDLMESLNGLFHHMFLTVEAWNKSFSMFPQKKNITYKS